MHKRLGFCSVVWTHLTVFSLITLLQISPLRADLVLVGDTIPDPNFSDAAGTVGGDLTIGVTGVGGLFMDIADPLVPPMMHLISDNGIIGDGPDSIGAAVFDDFGVVWEVDMELTIGDEGQGSLDVFESASIEVGSGPLGIGVTFVGKEATGQGVVTLNGAASRLTTAVLTVGNSGFGDIEVIDRGALISGISFVGREDGGDGTVTLTGRGTRWDLRGVLTIANNNDGSGTYGSATPALGRLTLADGALLQARSVSGESAVKVAPLGFIELSGGTLRQLDIDASGASLTAMPITIGGVIRGDGFVNASVLIEGSGEMRNAAAEVPVGGGVIQLREKLLVSGLVDNFGTIESLGGEMEFQSTVTNNLELIARDAVMRFLNDPNAPGLDNFGVIVLGGNTTVHGTITNNPSSSLTILPNSEVVVIGDLTFTATSLLALFVGDAQGTLDVVGTTDIKDSILAMGYTTGRPSMPGDTYTILSASGGLNMTTFANPGNQVFADGRFWDIDYPPGGNSVTVTAGGDPNCTLLIGADFNCDNIVDALDLAIWNANYGLKGPVGLLKQFGDADGDGDVDGEDFLKIQRDFGKKPVPLLAAVPEPSALLLALSALAFGYRRRVA